VAIYPDTSEFEHPEFTEADLPALRTHLENAAQQLELALRLTTHTSNHNLRAWQSRIANLRHGVHGLLNQLRHRF